MKVSSRVILTIEVRDPTTWDTACRCDQIFDQAGKETINRIRRVLDQSGMTIIGNPRVTVVMAESE